MEIQKPPCQFGAKCYRKNPKHLQTYSHPDKLNASDKIATQSKKDDKDEMKKGKMKQTTLLFIKNSDSSLVKRESAVSVKNTVASPKKKFRAHSPRKDVEKKKVDVPPTKKRKQLNIENKQKETGSKKAKTASCFKTLDTDESKDNSSSEDGESVPSTSWIFIKNESSETKTLSDVANLKNKTNEEIIKALFLVDMPSDFYSFYEFCKSLDENDLKKLHFGELKLVGPFDILSGGMNYSLDPDLYLCHWRFYFDPPEFQTILTADSGFHIGYWRDDPKEDPVFLASNNPNKDCVFKIEAENIFGAVFHYLSEYLKTSDPFKKVKIGKLLTAVSEWAEKNDFSLKKKTSKINNRQRKVVSKTFHSAGIVVPFEAKTELGYRPLNETDENLKKICKLIMEANDESEKDTLWENLQALITAANIANDECDFGNSLELGIDLFCMGSPVFHETVEHLLSTAYSLLDRTEFEKIIKAHLKFRRKSSQLSVDV